MGDRRISRKRKGNVLSSCVSLDYMNALETLTEKQQEKVQVYEKQPGIRIILGVKRAVKRNG